MSQPLYYLDKKSLAFPSLTDALDDPNGLLAVGGDLTPERIVNAYKLGIFPWFSEGDPILWWSPNPRAIIKLDQLRVNKTLKKFLKKSPYKVSVNKAFSQVIDFCANAPFRSNETWIVPAMKFAYKTLNKQGYAHSIEVWLDDELVGGLYGIAVNGYFSGESMFYRKSNASKVALIYLAQLLKPLGTTFIDCQITNSFLADMGCIEVEREQFVQLKAQALKNPVESSFWRARYL
ncbi:leucyl/phenylalanyl-tRNA--protein transferase [Thalassotalea sp. PLHSN55]|uniref:leucyl/phenylalanyl-tRNA--protein transferase n=1 Tax=Thalassotalea sp. PLHSN55 TaxID=3435888 RepID=UPI003F83BB1E